jgi:ribosome-associated protein
MTEHSTEPISKTRRKRDMHALQELGERLAGLNRAQVESLDLPEDLRDALLEAPTLTKHEARRRHMQYIGRLMRAVDPEPLRERLRQWDGQSSAHTALLHRVERWRDRLVEDENAAQELAQELGARGAQVNWQALRTQSREARLERQQNRPPKHYRELFRLIRDAMESKPEGRAEENPQDEGPAS